MLVRPDDGAIDHDVLEIRITPQGLENPLPNALLRPPIEALEHAVPMPKFCRQIAPRRARPQYPKHGINKQTIVVAVSASVALLARNQIRDKPPLCVRQFASNQDRLLKLRS